jgi:hypothetical protein
MIAALYVMPGGPYCGGCMTITPEAVHALLAWWAALVLIWWLL